MRTYKDELEAIANDLLTTKICHRVAFGRNAINFQIT